MKNKAILGWLLKITAMIFLIAPLSILTFYNRENWFDNGAMRVSAGFVITFLFALLLLKGAFKNLNKKFATIMTLFVLTLIVWLLDSIIKDLIWILIYSSVGYILYLIFDSIGSYLVNIWNVYKHENIRTKAREDYELENFVKNNVGNV